MNIDVIIYGKTEKNINKENIKSLAIFSVSHAFCSLMKHSDQDRI